MESSRIYGMEQTHFSRAENRSFTWCKILNGKKFDVLYLVVCLSIAKAYLFNSVVINRGRVPPVDVNKFLGGACSYAPYNMESLKFTNKYVCFYRFLKPGVLEQKTIT